MNTTLTATRHPVINWIWPFIVLVLSVGFYIFRAPHLDVYDIFVLIVSALCLVFLGYHWPRVQLPTAIAALISVCAVWLYAGQFARGETQFFLKYFFASQSALMWMSVGYFSATIAYGVGLALKSLEWCRWGRAITWCATVMGLACLLVRWHESYLIHPDYGHIPVSNLYEVFILFAVIAALLHLYYEERLNLMFLGVFPLAIISAAVIFTLWYAYSRGAAEIQPLVPALKSYWMKLHVPSNFIGYGCFSLAAMLSIAYLYRDDAKSSALPTRKVMADVIYRMIALGFAFFTIATILGALWAAEAWGNYWSWDPKETWALIVWLNYAAWLHFRLNKGWKGNALAWWAIVGLFITLFAFLGVNMFLSGLHSYGEL